jgi:hypothetical protein
VKGHNRGRYTHFIHDNGTVASLYPLETIYEARVGLICEKEFPSEASQYDAAEELASFAVGIKPHIIVTFDEGTSAFPAVSAQPSGKCAAGDEMKKPPCDGAISCCGAPCNPALRQIFSRLTHHRQSR